MVTALFPSPATGKAQGARICLHGALRWKSIVDIGMERGRLHGSTTRSLNLSIDLGGSGLQLFRIVGRTSPEKSSPLSYSESSPRMMAGRFLFVKMIS
jgi:hypothetical protein